jgi:hypothetical protein
MTDKPPPIALPNMARPQNPEARHRRALLATASRNAKVTLRKFNFQKE